MSARDCKSFEEYSTKFSHGYLSAQEAFERCQEFIERGKITSNAPLLPLEASQVLTFFTYHFSISGLNEDGYVDVTITRSDGMRAMSLAWKLKATEHYTVVYAPSHPQWSNNNHIVLKVHKTLSKARKMATGKMKTNRDCKSARSQRGLQTITFRFYVLDSLSLGRTYKHLEALENGHQQPR